MVEAHGASPALGNERRHMSSLAEGTGVALFQPRRNQKKKETEEQYVTFEEHCSPEYRGSFQSDDYESSGYQTEYRLQEMMKSGEPN